MRSVSKSYRGRTILSGVDLDIEEGEIHAIEGPNGSGKSVLFKLMCGFVRPDEGTVHIAPRFLGEGGAFPVSFGVIIDRPGYVGGLTGMDNLLRLAEIRGRVGRPEAEDAMRRVGLDSSIKQKVRNYSLGMKQKLELAQAFMEGQQVLVLDEPFNALDADSIDLVRALLVQLRQEGRTIVFTSHNAADIDALADRRYRIQAQRIAAA